MEGQRGKKSKIQKKKSLTNIWDTVKMLTSITETLEGEKRQNRTETTC